MSDTKYIMEDGKIFVVLRRFGIWTGEYEETIFLEEYIKELIEERIEDLKIT